MDNIIDCLSERGFIDQISNQEELKKHTENPIRVYVGFDPTSDSLHLGNLMGIVALSWFQKFGHTPFIILGGATGRIGDPSGKSVERPLLSDEEIESNISKIGVLFERILDFSGKLPKPVILNNNEWLKGYSFIDFLRDVGKQFRVGPMLAKESVKLRMDSQEGISFTEFSYQVLQAFDFSYLYKNRGVSLQMGGSDQWGNITAGIELTRKMLQKSVYGMTFPLLTRSDGKKFGKSEEGAIWLSEEKLSPYQFYQYCIGIPDENVIRLMKLLSFMDLEEIERIEKGMSLEGYIPNSVQKKLAEELTLLVHGADGLDKAIKVTQGAAPGAKTALNSEVLKEIAKDMPSGSLPSSDVIGQKIVDLFCLLNLTSSKSEAVRLIKNGGAYLNNERVDDVAFRLEENHLIDRIFILFGVGKKKKFLLEVESSEK